MKYCLNSNVNSHLLQEADEIAIIKEDMGRIQIFIDTYPNAIIIIPAPQNLEDWDNVAAFCHEIPDRILVAAFTAIDIKKCIDMKLPFFYQYAIATFSELRALKAIGAKYAILAPPIFFQMDKVKNIGLPIRACPNRCGNLGLFSPSIEHDTWILPSEINQYNDYIDTLFFYGKTPDAEGTIYKIYAKDKHWDATLDNIIKDFPPNKFESTIVQPLAPRRFSCGQTCEIDNRCHYCERILDVASGDVALYYLNALKEDN